MTSHPSLIDTLPLPQRLALSYASRRAQPPVLALLALDARLAGIVRADGEPMIAQIKLAWWRDRLRQPPADWPQGEPLLALLATSGMATEPLAGLVDGWEVLLADTLDPAAFAEGRAQGWAALDPAAAQPAREWALVDLALNLGTADEAAAVRDLARAQPWDRARLPAAMRPLAVLHGLARRALHGDGAELLAGPAAMLLAMRLGIFGR
ncbi:MAG: hypothetical protein KDE15_02145 [Erythrobacter sp.]|nr:hypothetical protein [Erythrobacter sp.]